MNNTELIAKLDDAISVLRKQGNNGIIWLYETARAYVAEPCPDCDESGVKQVVTRRITNPIQELLNVEPCPNPRHELISELRKVMGL